MSLISTVPHDPEGLSGIDSADFEDRPVNTWWLDLKQEEAGLGQCETPFVTDGVIEARYLALGGCSSVLGSPQANVLTAADGSGRFTRFTGGSSWWTFLTPPTREGQGRTRL